MPLLLCLALFVPLAFAVADATQRKFCEAVPAVFLGLSLVLYLLGVYSMLPCAVWLVLFVWIGCVLYLMFSVWHHRKKKGWMQPLVGLLSFIAGAVVLWWLCRGVRYAVWDEFSHWGRAVKAVHGQHLLPALAAGQDRFRDYPPGVSLIQALVLWLGRMEFREDVAIYVQGLFSLSLLLYPLRTFVGKRGVVRRAGAALLLALAPATVFWNYYLSTMVDGILGVLFAFILLVQFLGEGQTYDRFLQAMALAMLPLVKSSGLLFAAAAVIIIAIDEMKGTKNKKSAHPLQIPAWLPLIVVVAAAAGSWKLFLWIKQVGQRWQPSSFSVANFFGLFTGTAPEWQSQTAKSYFVSVFTETNYGWPVSLMSYMGVLVLCVGLFYALRLALPKKFKRRWDVGFWGLIVTGVVYILSLLATYLYFFSQYEAVRLASLSRYLNTYLATLLIFLTALLVHVVAQAKNWPAWVLPLVAGGAVWAVLANPVEVFTPLLTAPQYAVSSTANLQPFSDAAATIASTAKGEVARVYVVSQDDLGATTLRLGYELFPQALPDHVSSIGPQYADDDLLSLRTTREEWADVLQQGYEFVYLFEVDDAFRAEFGPLFIRPADIEKGNMFRVCHNTTGPILERVR